MIERPNALIERPRSGARVPGPSGTDVLSDVLRVFRATGAALLRGDFYEPWAWSAPPARAIAALLHPGATRLVIFHVVAEGCCWVEVAGEPRQPLQQGDVVCFPHGHPHKMGTGDALQCVPVAALFPPRPWAELPVLRHGGEGGATRIVCVYLRCDDLLVNPLLDSLPPMLVARPSQGNTVQWMNTNLHYLITEANHGNAGTSCLLARMTELLFIEMLRIHLAELEEQDTGWLAALKDRHVCRVLHLFHSNPSHHWQTAELAKEVGLSKSALNERFRQLLGTSPGRYLATWRLQLAAQALEQTHQNVGQIAGRVGFGSEEAFSRAFKRFTGDPPASWRKRRRMLTGHLLYERLGGAAGIRAIVDDVFALHLANPLINEGFANLSAEQVSRLKKVTCEFFGAGTGGPEVYTGRDLITVHKGMNITEHQYAAAIDDIAAALGKNGISENDKAEVIEILSALKDQVVL